MHERTGLAGLLSRTRRDLALRRESDLMGVYASITLLAALTAGADHSSQSQVGVLEVVWGTTVGLALAHWFALVLSAYLVRDPDLHHTPMEVFSSQLLVAAGICLAATVVVLLLPVDVERLGARLTAACFLGGLVVVEARVGGTALPKSLGYGVTALLCAVAVATAKWFLSY